MSENNMRINRVDGGYILTFEGNGRPSSRSVARTPEELPALVLEWAEGNEPGMVATGLNLYAPSPGDTRYIIDTDVELVIAERALALKNLDLDIAGIILDQLATRGIALEDGPEGTTWKRTSALKTGTE